MAFCILAIFMLTGRRFLRKFLQQHSRPQVSKSATSLASSRAPTWRISILRYFNPVGAHSSGEVGEDPTGIPNNLFPFVSQVAVGKLPHLNVFGDDYPTADGTGVRDYIHVVDLVKGHVKALDFLAGEPTLAVHNLGTGRGYSVLEIVKTFEAVY